MERLEEKWKYLTLIETEEEIINIDERNLLEEEKRGELCLVGKLLADRVINKEIIRKQCLRLGKLQNLSIFMK